MTDLVPLIDSHAHLDGPEYDGDRAAVLQRARRAGVAQIVLIGAGRDLGSARRAVALAESDAGLFATVGIHPHDVAEMQAPWWDQLAAWARRERVVGIGETGLDYHYDHSPRSAQKDCFRRFLTLARDVGKPAVCHVRDAHDDALSILAAHGGGAAGWVIHCFTGTPQDAAAYVELGCYISFSGIVTFKGKASDPLREAVRRVPLDRLLLETDCPYLAPVPMRGQRNEPAFLVHTAEVLAREAGIPLAELSRQTVANTRRLFALT